MALTIILFTGFVGVALVVLLAALAFIDVAFNVWDAADRANRDARFTGAPGTAIRSPRGEPVLVHHWAQSA